VRLNEHSDSVALYGGEQDEKRRLTAALDKVLRMMRRIVRASTRLTCITAGYGWFTIIAPIVVASPGYFGGDLSFGGLMMVVGAFIQVQQALRWFIDNFGTIADWRATLLRIASFREAVITLDRLGATEDRIEFFEAAGGTITFDDLEIATPKGCTTLSERHVGALAYPSPETAYTDEQISAVLDSAGLNRLCSSLDRIARWDRELTEDEQQCLVFTRLLLRKPRLAVIDEALHALQDDARLRMTNLFLDGLKDAAVLNIGRPETSNHLFKRVVHLIDDPLGRCFIPDLGVTLVDQPIAAPTNRPVSHA
jgi:putative ATP-binding cassette transporter